MERDDVHGLTAAYALNALDHHEEAEYEAHLDGCETCRRELASLQEAATAFAFGVEAPPPRPGLRSRILAEARRERERLVPTRRRWALTVAAASAVIAATVAVGLGVWAASLSSALDDERHARALDERATAVLADPAAKRFPIRTEAGVEGTLVVASGGGAALAFSSLDRAPEGALYEAWVGRDAGSMRPAGTFTSRGAGTIVALRQRVPADGLVAVTIEDEPVERPTSDPILAIKAA